MNLFSSLRNWKQAAFVASVLVFSFGLFADEPKPKRFVAKVSPDKMGGHAWADAGNWKGGALPSSSDEALVEGQQSASIFASANSVRALSVVKGGILGLYGESRLEVHYDGKSGDRKWGDGLILLGPGSHKGSKTGVLLLGGTLVADRVVMAVYEKSVGMGSLIVGGPSTLEVLGDFNMSQRGNPNAELEFQIVGSESDISVGGNFHMSAERSVLSFALSETGEVSPIRVGKSATLKGVLVIDDEKIQKAKLSSEVLLMETEKGRLKVGPNFLPKKSKEYTVAVQGGKRLILKRK